MEWDLILNILTESVRKSNRLNEIKDLESVEAIFHYVYHISDVRNLLIQYLKKRAIEADTKNKKCERKGEQLREKGNQQFKNKKYAESLKFYTKSLNFAPGGSENFSLALANRSAASFYMNKFEECIADVDLAILYNYPASKTNKLQLRKANCLLNLQRYSEASKFLEELKAKTDNATELNSLEKLLAQAKQQEAELQGLRKLLAETSLEDAEDEKDKYIIKLKSGENPSFKSASSCLMLNSTVEKGRHVIATSDIAVGDVLFYEEPFAFVVLTEFQKMYCHNCSRLVATKLLCLDCLDSTYCSETCRLEAQSIHKFECGYLRLLNTIGIAHLGLRVLLRCGTLENIKLYHKIATGVKSEKKTDELCTRYGSVYNLVTNIKLLPVDDVFQYSVTAVLLLLYLKHYTTFFKESCVQDDELVGSLLLRHVTQLVCNGHSIRDSVITPNDVMTEDDVCGFAHRRICTAIYPASSMMNHSCDPNIISSFDRKFLIIKSYREISKGEEVYNCYGPHYRRMLKTERQDILQSQYCFKCECTQCLLMFDFMERFTSFKCPKCEGPVVLQRTKESKRNKDQKPWICLDCSRQQDINQETLELSLQVARLKEEGCRILEAELNVQKAVKKFLTSSSIGLKILYKHHEDLLYVFDQLAKCKAMTGNNQQSVHYIEKCLPGIIERYGDSSVEYAYELDKLSRAKFNLMENSEYKKKDSDFRQLSLETMETLNKAKKIFTLFYGSWSSEMEQLVRLENMFKMLLLE